LTPVLFLFVIVSAQICKRFVHGLKTFPDDANSPAINSYISAARTSNNPTVFQLGKQDGLAAVALGANDRELNFFSFQGGSLGRPQ